MIQRIQSVYLFAGAVALLSLTLFSRLRDGSLVPDQGWFPPVIMGVGVVIAGLAIATIFMYKTREKQRKVVTLVQSLALVLTACLYGMLFLNQTLTIQAAEGTDLGLVALLALPPLAYILFWLARRGIDKDIKLIRSMDRLRG